MHRSAPLHTGTHRFLCLLPLFLIAGCAQPLQRVDSLAQRCFYAASIAADVKTTPEARADVCDTALLTISLSRRDQAATYTNRGIVRLNQSSYEHAKKDFDEAVRLAPEIGEPYVNRAAALLALHRYNEAIVDLDRAIQLRPTSIEKAYYNRAIAREKSNDIRGAYDDYLKAAEIRPDWKLPREDLQRFKVITRSRRLA
jgi:tetratricopeptide (TPR) repeat protein